jgi:hypothetical protein
MVCADVEIEEARMIERDDAMIMNERIKILVNTSHSGLIDLV